MNERALHFGPGGSLLGILTLAAGSRLDAPGLILLNAGLIHRVGPNRLYVTLARRLAALGFPCLRFDISGIGDSVIAGRDMPISERALRDIRLAMDVVTQTVGCDRFVVMGLCAGAVAAHVAAVADERVAGSIQLDGYAYPTLGSYVRHYLPKAAQIASWIGLFKRVTTPASARPGGPEFQSQALPEIPPKRVFARELASLIERRTALLFLSVVSTIKSRSAGFVSNPVAADHLVPGGVRPRRPHPPTSPDSCESGSPTT